MKTPEPPGPGAGKDVWRHWARSVRRSGIPAAVSASVTEAIRCWLPGAPNGKVVLYLPLPDEVDLTDLLRDEDRQCALTRTPASGPLTLHAADGPRERHRLGFEQPRADAPHVDPSTVGVVLVPGLVFDRAGQRLGRGAGYYDSFLPKLNTEVPRVAVVPSWMVVEAIPTEPHDIAMTHLATEAGVQAVSGT